MLVIYIGIILFSYSLLLNFAKDPNLTDFDNDIHKKITLQKHIFWMAYKSIPIHIPWKSRECTSWRSSLTRVQCIGRGHCSGSPLDYFACRVKNVTFEVTSFCINQRQTCSFWDFCNKFGIKPQLINLSTSLFI